MEEHKVYELTDELVDEMENLPIREYFGVLKPICSCCGKRFAFKLTRKETDTLLSYNCRGRSMGYIQEVFPEVPAWIRSGAIDQYSDGFCICPECVAA